MTAGPLRARLSGPLVRQIAGNTGWLLAERLLRGLIAVTVTVAVARHLGPGAFGVLSYALSFVLLFATFWTLGLSGVIVHDLVREPKAHDEIVGTLFALRLLGGALGIGAILLTASALAPGVTTRLSISVIAVATLFYAFDGVDYWLQSEVRSRYAVMARGGALVAVSAANLVLIAVDAPVVAFAAAAGAEFVLAGLALLAVYVGLGRSPFAWRPSWVRARNLVSRSWPLMLSGAMYSVNLKIDQVMLGNMADAETVGTYAAAVRLSEVWYFIPIAIAASSFPALVRSREESKAAYRARLQRLYDLMVWLSLPLALGVALVSGGLVPILFGAAYAGAAPILAIHVWAAPFIFLGAIFSRWLIAENLLRFSLVRHGAGALVNVAINLVLIPTLGGLGAAAATLISYAVASYVVCFAYGPTRPAAQQMTMALLAPLRAVAAGGRAARARVR